VELDLPLAEYESPAADGGYSFPARPADLGQGEYWTGLSTVHGAAGGGTQLFAYDLLIRAFDSATNSWPTSVPGSDNTKNLSYYMWSKPVYAMADGVVVEFLDGMATNTPPGLPIPTPNPVEGNHFYIQHGDDLALYAHFQAGTLNPALTSGPNADGSGATVTQGQQLGLAGNSGNSSEPHLHIQVNRGTIPWAEPTRPLPFNDIYVLDLAAVPDVWPPNDDAPWNAVSAQALPSVNSAIWPGPLKLGKKKLYRWIGPLAWAWIIFIGGLMITPGGVGCPACGPGLTKALGLVSIVLGVLGFVSRAVESRAVTQRNAAPRIDVKADLHS
jgi:Peptidase family M23